MNKQAKTPEELSEVEIGNLPEEQFKERERIMETQKKKLDIFNRARKYKNKFDEENDNSNEKYTKWYKRMDQQDERVMGIIDDEQEKE